MSENSVVNENFRERNAKIAEMVKAMKKKQAESELQRFF